MATRLRNLYEDNEHYNKSFQLYIGKLREGGKMERWYKTVFHDDILPRLDINIPDGRALRTLGIGSGSGEIECLLLKQLLQKFPRISNHVVEPSAELAAKYKSHIAATNGELDGINYNWYQQLLEEYKEKRDQESDETKFHFISACDSLYYVNDLGKWLDYLYDLLDDGGILLVILLGDESDFVKMWAEFPGLGNKSKFGFSENTSADVRKHFEQRKLKFSYFSGELNGVDMARAFDEEPSIDADLLLDFVSHTIDFRKDADPELRDKFMKYLRQCLQPVGADKLIFNTNSGMTIVQK